MRFQPVVRRIWQEPFFGYAAALAAVGAVSAIIAAAHLQSRLANTSMLYLIAVLATAVYFGHGPAIVAAVASFLAFDWFFVLPTSTLTVADPAEWVSLLLFLVTALVTSQLAASQRREAREARGREREALVLFDVARLMGDPDLEHALRLAAQRLRQDLLLSAVVIDVQTGTPAHLRAEAGDEEHIAYVRTASSGSRRLLGEGAAPTLERSGTSGRWIRIVPPASPRPRATWPRLRLHVVPIRTGGQRIGQIAVVRPADQPDFGPSDDRLLSAIASQLGVAVEHARLQGEATEAEILRRTDELKTTLINAVSHDFRTPLATIVTGAESLLQSDVNWTEDDRRDFAEAIRGEALRLNRIVGNLLDLSRIEAGSLRPQKDWVQLRTLIDEVLSRLKPIVGAHPLRVDVPDDLRPVKLDYVEIDQVLSNLIENAARYSPADRPIEVTARAQPDSVEVAVADRGPGIPPEALGHVFDAFFRLQRPSSRAKGVGLGLAVARGLVEAHGGTIRAENRPGGGARFVFTLPRAEKTDGQTR